MGLFDKVMSLVVVLIDEGIVHLRRMNDFERCERQYLIVLLESTYD